MSKQQRHDKIVIIVLLVLSIILTSEFIGTIAKYLTSSSNSSDAVVAKFGLNTSTAIDLFSDSYTNVTADTDGKKIIAPGTMGHYNFKVIGTSEVAYKVDANITVTYSEEWGEYKPLEFSIDGTTWTNIEQFKINLKNSLASKVLSPNEIYNSTQAIHWRWPFSISDENDTQDTKMGIAAATKTAPKVTVDVELIAAQID